MRATSVMNRWKPLVSLLAILMLHPATATADDILAPGNPPLTEKLVWEYALTMGSILDFSLAPADLDFFRTQLKSDWQAKQNLRMGLINGKRALENKSAAERAAGFERIRPQVLALLEKSAAAGDREAQFLVAKSRGKSTPPAYAPSAPPAAPGDARIDALLTPRNENDTRLDTDGILADKVQSVYPPPAPRTRDALADAFEVMSTERSYLREADLRKMVRYFEWSLEVPLVNSERNHLRRALIAAHDRNGGKDPMYEFLAGGVGYKLGGVDLSFLDNPFEDHKRRELQRERLPQMRGEAAAGNPLARWLLARYDAANPALTPGPDPLTPAVARVYAEHVVFALNEVVGKEIFTQSSALTKALLRKLIADWPKLSEARRKEITSLPFDWAATKKGWPARPDHEKTELRLAWGKEFSPVFPEIKPVHDARVAEIEKAKAKLEAERRKQQAAEDARLAKMTPQQRAQESVQNQMLANQKAMMGFQQRMQMQQQMIQNMRNMQLEQHVTNLNIASNIGGGGTTWRVVYR